MIGFTDTDCLFKLAACDILEESLATIGVAAEDVRLSPEARQKWLRDRTRLEHSLTVEGYRRAGLFLKGAIYVTQAPDPTEELLLSNMYQMDAGEIVLICATRFARGAFLVASGDKKWPRELTRVSQCSTIRERLSGRLLCFEQIVLRVIEAHKFPPIRRKIVMALSCDQVLQQVFAEGEDTTKQAATARLRGKIATLRRETGVLLMSDD